MFKLKIMIQRTNQFSAVLVSPTFFLSIASMNIWCNTHLELCLCVSVTMATLTGSRYVTANGAPRLSKWRPARPWRRCGSGTDRESLSRSGYIIVPVTDRVSRPTTTEGIFPLSAHTGHFVSVASANGSSNKYKRHFIVFMSFLNHVTAVSSRWLLLFFCKYHSDRQGLNTIQLPYAP